MLDLPRRIDIQGRKFYLYAFIKYTFNISLCPDTYDLICFELGVMLDTANLCCVLPVWMTLIFTQGRRFTGKLELVTQMYGTVDYLREMTSKETVSMANVDRLSVSSCFIRFFVLLWPSYYCVYQWNSFFFMSCTCLVRWLVGWFNKALCLSAVYLNDDLRQPRARIPKHLRSADPAPLSVLLS